MLDDFTRLRKRTEELGNHHRKYVHAISATKDVLSERLEVAGIIDEVHFWSAAPDVAAEMEIVVNMGRDVDEKLAFLGSYFSFQFLHMNIRAVDVLRLGLSARADRFRVYRDFMLKMGADLRSLTAAYMEKLLDLFLAPAERPEFVICSVGTRADQDDLDLGIVDDGSVRRAGFNRAIGRMQREMLRSAIPLHMYLSEHVGEQSFSASIDEYRRLLEHEIQDFITISEMLGARPILGSKELFSRFCREITDRYYYYSGRDNRYHEGYLRGMLGEIRSLLLWELKSDSINPKPDALRIIKGIIFAQKTVYGLAEVNAWDILRQLVASDPRHQQVYEELENALSFIETFRFLYQLLEVQEEEILLYEEGSRAQLESVAELMGYQDVGVVHAYDHLLIHYHEHVQNARAMARLLMSDLQKHLEKISVFSGLLRTRGFFKAYSAGDGNLAVQFVNALRFFRGTKFWDDVMGPMETDLELLRQFVDDFNSLPPEDRRIWIQRYAKWGETTSIAVFRLLVILHKSRHKMSSLSLLHDLSMAFIDRISRCSDVIPRLTSVFHHFPRLVHDFLFALREPDKRRFAAIFEGEVWSEEVEVLRRRLLHFCRLHCCASHYFRRFMQRIIERHAEYALLFDQTDRLRTISNGIFARIENLQTFEQKRDELGNYYDIEFMRIGLECLAGATSERTNAEFTEFSDNYLQTLFEVCKQEVRSESEGVVRTRDLVALYSAGGHGRKLAFDDDYDLIILLNSDEPAIREFCVRVIAKMNREIVRRGTMPHYRFAEHFGEYVTTFSELRSLFGDPDEQVFIDMSQLLGARKLVGSQKFEHQLNEEIIQPLILARRESFSRQMAGEIRSRHRAVDAGIISPLDLKETKGGLRDIELLLLILMANAGLWHPVTQELRGLLVDILPERRAELDRVFDAFIWLKRLRDIYRLTVAAEDEVLEEEIGYMAQVLGYCSDPECTEGPRRVIEDFQTTTREMEAIVASFLDERGL